MTVYELLSAYKPILQALDTNGYQMRNVRDVEIYEEYLNLAKTGGKKDYHVALLADKYSMGKSTIWRILANMKKPAKL